MTAKPEAVKLDAKVRNSKKTMMTATDVRGVVYGKKHEPISIVAERLALERIHDNLGYSVIFDLAIDGKDKNVPVLLHDVQRQPNSNRIIHFDLYAVTMDQKIKTEVPIRFNGEAAAQADSSKTLNTIFDALEIEALPADLPEFLDIDVSDLAEVGDTKYVSDIQLPAGVVILNDPEAAVIKVEEVHEEAEEPAEEAESSEGEDASEDSADKSEE